MQSNYVSLLLTNILCCVGWVVSLREPAWPCPTSAWHTLGLLEGHEFPVWDADTGQWHVASWLRARLCHEIWAAACIPACGESSPHFYVWTVRQPHSGNVGTLPHNHRLWPQASPLLCLLGIWKREKNYDYLLTPEGRKALRMWMWVLPWGSEGNIQPPDLAKQRKTSDVNTAME